MSTRVTHRLRFRGGGHPDAVTCSTGRHLLLLRLHEDRPRRGPALPLPLHGRSLGRWSYTNRFMWKVDCSRISSSCKTTEGFSVSPRPQGLASELRHLRTRELLSPALVKGHPGRPGVESRPPDECDTGTALPKAKASPETRTTPRDGLEGAPAKRHVLPLPRLLRGPLPVHLCEYRPARANSLMTPHGEPCKNCLCFPDSF